MAKRGANEGAIFQRKDGRWCSVIDLGWENGKRNRKSFYGATRKKVAEDLNKALREKARGLPVVLERQTLDQFLGHWLEDVVQPSTRPATFSSYADTMRLHVVPDLGRFLLSKLAPMHVQSLLNKKLKQGLSRRYVSYIRSVLRIALSQAVKWNLVAYNVVDRVDPPRVERHQVRSLDSTSACNFLGVVKGDRLETLYSIALSVGLRRGEILGLRWQDLDLEAGTLSVKQTVQRIRGKGMTFAPPKTDRARRTVNVPSPVIASLRRHRRAQLEERLKAGSRWHEFDLVFPSNIGTPLEPRNLDRHFKRMLAKTGLPNMRFHDLRHTAASLMLAANVNPRTAADILGHSRISVTLDTYSHVMPPAMHEAADRISAVLWSQN